MKAEELMVGDWVNCTYPAINKCLRVAEIKTVADDELKVVLFDDVRLVFPEKYIDPVPITPEILEKNGFNLRENIVVGGPKFVHEQDDGRIEIVIWLQDGMFMEVRKNIYYEDEICYTLPVPFFVHELQHCLKLCGINKTIEL